MVTAYSLSSRLLYALIYGVGLSGLQTTILQANPSRKLHTHVICRKQPAGSFPLIDKCIVRGIDRKKFDPRIIHYMVNKQSLRWVAFRTTHRLDF